MVVVFMAAVIVGTILIYFFVLPKAAPKEITIAVLPFDSASSLSRELKIGLAADLRDGLAYSRDVKVVDFASSLDYVRIVQSVAIDPVEKDPFHILGATHIVDGHYEGDPQGDELTLTVRLINTSGFAWKEVHTERFSVTTDDLEPLKLRLIEIIRSELYDFSNWRVPQRVPTSSDYNVILAVKSHEFEDLARLIFEESSNTLRSIDVEPSLAEVDYLSAHCREMRHHLYDGTEAFTLLRDAQRNLIVTKNITQYQQDIENISSDYPNSRAVWELAQFYIFAEWWVEAESLLLHWSELRPRSIYPAIEVALLRMLQDDQVALDEAIEVLSARRKYRLSETCSANRYVDQILDVLQPKQRTERESIAPNDPFGGEHCYLYSLYSHYPELPLDEDSRCENERSMEEIEGAHGLDFDVVAYLAAEGFSRTELRQNLPRHAADLFEPRRDRN